MEGLKIETQGGKNPRFRSLYSIEERRKPEVRRSVVEGNREELIQGGLKKSGHPEEGAGLTGDAKRSDTFHS